MLEKKEPKCRFRLSNIVEGIISSEIGYDVFEPLVSLDVDGKNVFEALGISGVKNPVIMHSLEKFLSNTLKLIGARKEYSATDEYSYWLLGTGFGFKLRRSGSKLVLFLEVDGAVGPVQGVAYPQSIEIGKLSTQEWVECITALAENLLSLFKRLNPTIYSAIGKQELQCQELRTWLVSGGK